MKLNRILLPNNVQDVNYTVQSTNDDPNSNTNAVNPNAVTWVNDPDLNMVSQTATAAAQMPAMVSGLI